VQNQHSGQTIEVGCESGGLYHLNPPMACASSASPTLVHHHQPSCLYTMKWCCRVQKPPLEKNLHSCSSLWCSSTFLRGVLPACPLINHMPSSVLNNQILSWTLKSNFILSPGVYLGRHVFSINSLQVKIKVNAKSLKYIFLGYSWSHKGYRCFSLSLSPFLQWYVVSIDVTFLKKLLAFLPQLNVSSRGSTIVPVVGPTQPPLLTCHQWSCNNISYFIRSSTSVAYTWTFVPIHKGITNRETVKKSFRVSKHKNGYITNTTELKELF